MPRIVISYRRDDSAAITGRIYDRLVQVFGSRNIFRDIDAIPAGSDFRQVIGNAMASCDVMLIIIGTNWSNIRDETGQKRFDNPNDFVRIEVETSLRLSQQVRVIPVLVNGADMPGELELPPTLRELPYRNAVNVRNDPDFGRDIERLIRQIKQSNIRGPKRRVIDKEWINATTGILSLLVAILACVAAYWALIPEDKRWPFAENQKSSSTPTFILTHTPSLADLPTVALTATAANTVIPTGTDTLSPSLTSTPTVSPTPSYTSTTTNTATWTSTATRVEPTITATNTPTTGFTPTLSLGEISTATITPYLTTEIATLEVSAEGFVPTIESFNGHEFALVPAGPFSDTRGSANEAFWIGVYEVTNAQFAAFLNVRGSNLSVDLEPLFNDKGPSVRIYRSGGIWRVEEGFDDHPAVYVTWHGAQDYCDYINARLPTATEWHKAAAWNPTTGQASIYPWGDTSPSPDIANYGSSHNGTTSVAFFPNGRSVVGAYNMSGNVAEWVADVQGTNRLWSGGAWNSDAAEIRSEEGGIGIHTFASASIGFRCARDF